MLIFECDHCHKQYKNVVRAATQGYLALEYMEDGKHCIIEPNFKFCNECIKLLKENQ